MSKSVDTKTYSSPPTARLTFRVGIVGHRPDRLRRADIPSLTTRLAETLSSVKKSVEDFSAENPALFSNEPSRLRAVSPLAEGTDRYFAREALRLGYELCCPLPFAKKEFENDFKPEHSVETGMDSVADFNNLLQEANSKLGLVLFELDGFRTKAAEAYAAAGRVVLNQSDLLIVVWDGCNNNKRGGTYETLKEALTFSVPVLWVDAHAPHDWQFLLKESELPISSDERCVPKKRNTSESKTLSDEIKTIVDQTLEPPKPPNADIEHGGPKPDLRAAYFAERKPARNWGFVWKLFRDLVGSFSFRIQKLRVRDFEETVSGDWPKDAPGVAGWVNTRLIGHYAWSDKLADFYADKYRSSFVLCYLLGALAVMLALFPLLMNWNVSHFSIGVKICSVSELIAVAWILVLVLRGNKRRWHDRWMEYRLVAELVRQLRFLIPLGGGRPFPRTQPHLLSYGNPANSWIYWHLRAIDRAVGLPNARLDSDYLTDCLGYMAKVLRSQISFHHTSSERSKRIEHRLHTLGVCLFGLTFILIAINVLVHCVGHDGAERFELTFFCAVLPSVGAALAAIKNQGEFARIARRSRAMEDQLNQANKDLEGLQTKAALRSDEAATHALRAAQLMVDEVLDWRVVFLDRPLVTPA